MKRDMLGRLVLVENAREPPRTTAPSRPRLRPRRSRPPREDVRGPPRAGVADAPPPRPEPGRRRDATQQTYLVAAERLADINPDSERAFLVGTALRVARSLGRKTGRWQLENDMDLRAADARSVSDERAAIELCDLALSKVDPGLAEVFVLFELEELSSPGDRRAARDPARNGGLPAAARA